MSLTVQRKHIPIKGVNTIAPIREMSTDYAPRLDNIWFDQAGDMNRRPGQRTYDNGAPGGTLETLFEHIAINDVKTIFAWSSNTNVYQLATTTWGSVTALAGIFTSRPTTAQISGQTIVGDGTNVRYYNGSAWATPTGVNPMAFFTSYNGRMYGAGDPTSLNTIYFSDSIGGSGVADWTTTTVGGFLTVDGAIGYGDKVVGLCSFQGMLVALCENSIIFYSGSDPTTPSTFRVDKVIRGIGCISHDSIQGVGNDVIFLAKSGFKSLKEVLVQGDAAVFDTSSPINNYVMDQLRLGNVLASGIRSTYAENLGVYLCTFGDATLVYHSMFDAWTYWYGLQPTLLTSHGGTTYLCGTRLHYLSSTAYGDIIDGGTEIAATMVWETAPFRSAEAEIKSRWNRGELIFEGMIGDTVTVQYWIDLINSTSDSYTYTLEGTGVISVPTSMLWSATASTDPRRAWGTATTGPSWGGTFDYYSGDQTMPVSGRGEFITFKITNGNITKFKIVAMEAYNNAGGVRG